jgi:hypothetical protein
VKRTRMRAPVIALTSLVGSWLATSPFVLAELPEAPRSARGASSATMVDAGMSPALPATAQPDDAKAYAAARALLTSLAPDPNAPLPPEPVVDPARIAPRASVLGIPRAPPVPAPRTRFQFASDDPAGVAARSIARRTAAFANLRAQVPGAVWLEDENARFAIRGSAACLEKLAQAGIRAHPLTRELTTPIATPVVLDAPIAGVAFVSLHPDRDVEVSCELALRLKPLARILRKHGVRAVGVSSSYRERPKVSFHTFGLALDLMAFRTDHHTWNVADTFEVTADVHTCDGAPRTPNARALLALLCAVADSRLFSSILTPNYNEGHRDHVHLDLRPDDPRLFVR